MGDMTEPAVKPTTIDPCPTCGGQVEDVHRDVVHVVSLAEPFVDLFVTVPCGHRVEYTIRPDGHVKLSLRLPE
jgi:hypothetical protein